MKNIFPPIEILIEMQPEEISEYLLLHLNKRLKEETPRRNKFHRYNETHASSSTVMEYGGAYADTVSELLSQAWVWLFVQGFIAPAIDDNNDQWVMITKRGMSIQSVGGVKKLSYSRLLSKDSLDLKLIQKAWPIFLRGDFDTAVFAAFKEVEVRIRTATGLPSTIYGQDLVKEAFNSDKGLLTDLNNPNKSERDAEFFLFSGAIGAFKNPTSHRDVDFESPHVAASLIMLANTLIGIVDKRAAAKDKNDQIDLKLAASA